jgi:hypothetical protein
VRFVLPSDCSVLTAVPLLNWCCLDISEQPR